VGEYGSTVFDSDHDREYLLMFVCDECLCRGQRKLLHWEKGVGHYQEFDPGPQYQPRLPTVTLEATPEGRLKVFRKLGALSQGGKLEEAERLKEGLLMALELLDHDIAKESMSVEEQIADMNKRQSSLSASFQELMQEIRPAPDQDNIKSFRLTDIPKMQERLREIENEEKN